MAQGGRSDWVVLTGNARDVLAELPENKIFCCVTSPPYFNMREYNDPSRFVWGGDPYCSHDWGEPESDRCWLCNAWQGSLGRELTPERYIADLTEVFRQVRNVLHPKGTCWVNLGDGYAGSGRGPSGHNAMVKHQTERQGGHLGGAIIPPGYKRKDYFNLPSLLGEALRKDGWYLRSKIIWRKPNAKPGSYRDRPVLDYEEILLLTKSDLYYYDYYATLEPAIEGGVRAPRAVWDIPTEGGYQDPAGAQHYATFPVDLPRRCILAGAPPWVCKRCFTPYQHVAEVTRNGGPNLSEGRQQQIRGAGVLAGGDRNVTLGRTREIQEVGYLPDCGCPDPSPIPSTVLDPFGGTMTTGEAALDLGLRFLGIESNPDYAQVGRRRLASLDRHQSAVLN